METLRDFLEFFGSYSGWVVGVCLFLAGTIIFLLVVCRPGPSNPALIGDWTGLFREYREADKIEAISSESVSIQLVGGNVSADLSGSDGQRRNRKARGRFEGDTLILHYFVNEPTRVGGSAFVLKGDPGGGLLQGYWLGYDPELRRLMSCPYVLGRSQDIDRLKRENRAWLDQPCYPSSSVTASADAIKSSG